MTRQAEVAWAMAAREAGWEDVDEIVNAVAELATRLDGKRAEPLGYCVECGTPLLDGRYKRFAHGVAAEASDESWGEPTPDGGLRCPDGCNSEDLREIRGMRAMPAPAPVIRRTQA